MVDAAPAIDASPSGSATITGTLAEQTVDPTSAFYETHPVVGYKVLVMPESGVVCQPTGPTPGLTAAIGFPCGPAESRTYAARAPGSDCAVEPYVWILVEGFDGEFSEYVAETGSVTVSAIAPTIQGTFSAGFGDKGALMGTFDAIACP